MCKKIGNPVTQSETNYQKIYKLQQYLAINILV